MRPAILVDYRFLAVIAHSGGPHDMPRATVDQCIGRIGLHHPIGRAELLEDKLMDIQNRLETSPHIVVIVKTILNQRPLDSETIGICRKTNTIGL